MKLGQSSLALSLELIGATLAVFVWAVRCAVIDVRAELRKGAKKTDVKTDSTAAEEPGVTTDANEGGSNEERRTEEDVDIANEGGSNEKNRTEQDADIEVALALGQATEA